MIRAILPAALYIFAFAVQAEPCRNIPHSQKNCVRALACIGAEGLYFDGRARGWDRGLIRGAINDGTECAGMWDSSGPMGTGFAELVCDDGAEIRILYYSQDSETGTVIGAGEDNLGRKIRGWSGQNVLRFLTEPGVPPRLPCRAGPIPIS